MKKYVNHLIGLTIKEIRSIFPRIVVIINWVIDQLIMLFCKLTIKKDALLESKELLTADDLKTVVDWRDVNGTNFSSLERPRSFYTAVNGTQVDGFMVLMNKSVTREQTTAVQ